MKPIAGLRKHQTGAVAIMVGLTIVVLVAFLGMTVDLGRLFITKTELSNAADACSLAAAAELNGAADSLDRAVSAGTTVGQRNKVGFQGSAVTIFPADITFSANLQGTYQDKTAATPANMKYAKCTLPQTGIIPYFMQVMNFGPQTVTSHAVATLSPGITNCALPIGICKNKTPPPTCTDGSTPDAMGLCRKEWYCSKFSPGPGGSSASPSACPGFGATGNFNWIDFDPDAPTPGCTGGGASELACIITGTGQCNLNITKPVGQTGNIQAIEKAWNTRFGLYKGSDSVSTAPPDFSGFAYTPTSWPSKYDAFAGTSGTTPHLGNLPGDTTATSARKANLPYQGDLLAGFSPPGTIDKSYSNSTTGQLSSSGSDRRVALVPIVDCDGWATPPHTTPILKFACIVMLHPMTSPQDPTYLEYQGLTDLSGSPCATTGLPGGPGSVGPRVPALVR